MQSLIRSTRRESYGSWIMDEQPGAPRAYAPAVMRSIYLNSALALTVCAGLGGLAFGAGRVPELVATDVVAGLSTPKGTSVMVVADAESLQVKSPTALAFGAKGEMYVTETHRLTRGIQDNRRHLYWVVDDISSRTTADRMRMHEKWQDKEANTSLKFMTEISEVLRVLREPDAAGVYARQQVYGDGFNGVLDGTAAGVFEYEGTVYLACIPKIYALRDTDGDGVADQRNVIQDGFGVHVSLSGHDLNGFVLGADGRIYGTMGDRGFHGTTRERRRYDLADEGFVFRFDPDGSNFEVIHTGLRNPKEVAFDDFGNLISVDNNCDHGDKARVVYIVDGGDSGWHIGHQAMLSFHKQIGMEKRPPAAWLDERMWELPNEAQPAFLLPPVAHLTSGPSGFAYHPGAGFLESEAGRFFICDYRGGAAKSGIWSFQVEPEGAGMRMSDSYLLARGVAATDVDFSWDGRMTVTDFIGGWESHAGGRVFTVSADKPYRAQEAAQAAELMKAGFEKRAAAELESLLFHPDQRIRVRAQLALTRKPEAVDAFLRVASQTENRIARLHGVWGLGVIARRGAAVLPGADVRPAAHPALRQRAAEGLLILLAVEDAEVRAQAIRALGESGLKPDDIPFAKLMTDAAPRVRFFATTAAGRMKHKASLPEILTLLETADDLYLRHAGTHALALLGSAADLTKLAGHGSSAVRMAAVVALRKQRSPELARFLSDADPRVVDEAVRAINDLDIVEVRAQVAALLDGSGPANRSVMIWRRLLHSAFRAGDEVNAQRVLKVALDPDISEAIRAEALRLLGKWGEPQTIDQSTGLHAPLPMRDNDRLREVLAENIQSLVRVEGGLLDAALTLVKTHDLDFSPVPDAALKALVLNEELPGTARVDALELYAARKAGDLPTLVRTLAVGGDDACAIAALRMLAETDPQAALESAAKTIQAPGAWRQQQAWKIVGGIDLPAAAGLIALGLTELKTKHGTSPGALELLEVAAKRGEPGVKEALAAFQAAQASSKDPLAPWLPSLEGGDAVRGGELFASHPAGQCTRCHAVGHGGGDAGPDLADIGGRVDRRHLLEALVLPAARVADGYGIASATLKSGKVIGGIVLGQTGTHVDFDSAGTVLRAAREDIQSMTPPVSAMPHMGYLLQADEIRDIVAWLAGQQAKPKRKPKAAEPVMVR